MDQVVFNSLIPDSRRLHGWVQVVYDLYHLGNQVRVGYVVGTAGEGHQEVDQRPGTHGVLREDVGSVLHHERDEVRDVLDHKGRERGECLGHLRGKGQGG